MVTVLNILLFPLFLYRLFACQDENEHLNESIRSFWMESVTTDERHFGLEWSGSLVKV